jgi:hypothetical protein
LGGTRLFISQDEPVEATNGDIWYDIEWRGDKNANSKI